MGDDMNLEEAKANFGKEIIFNDSIFENRNKYHVNNLKLAYRILIFDTRGSFVCINLFDDQNEMIDSFYVEPKHIKLKEQPRVKELNKFVHLKSTEMTWQDALRAVADGKDVEAEGFYNIKEWLELNIGTAKGFRLKPKTIHIDGGDYTKEELLDIIECLE